MQVIGRQSLFIVGALGLCVIAACNYGDSGGSTDGGASSAPRGVVSVAVADVASQGIESFTIDVTGLQLGRADGSRLNVLTTPVTIDFSRLTDTSLLLRSLIVPIGVYNFASITFDFTNATCVLSGQQTPATIVGADGEPVSGTRTLDIEFNEASLDVIAGHQSLLEFDLDLRQSADVDVAHNTVELEPIVVLNVDGSSRELLTLGSLVAVVPSQKKFTGTIGSPAGERLGSVMYSVNDHTIYQIDGVPAAAMTGLARLAHLPLGAPIQVIGAADPNSPSIFASYVEVGRGTDNGGTGIVEGDVIDRLGNPSAGSNFTLKVLGHSSNALHTFLQFGRVFTATVNFANTKVVRFQSSQVFDTDEINVGQRVRIYGMLNGTVMFANLPTSVVREQEVHALGNAIASSSVSGGPTRLTMSLRQLELLPQESFTWPDSGLTPPDPAAFAVNAGVQGSPLNLTSGTPIEVVGYFAAITDAQQDFAATSLIDLDTAPSFLFVSNKPNGFTVVVATSPAEIQVEIIGTAGPGEKAIIDHGFAGFVQLPTTPTPTIGPASASGVYTIQDKQSGTETAYVAFDSFASALANRLSQGGTIRTLGAFGVYASPTNSIQATTIGVVIQ